jgi:formylglycine-generating enzyme required for sulfatase activity
MVKLILCDSSITAISRRLAIFFAAIMVHGCSGKEMPEIEWTRVHAGTFHMGSSPEERCREYGGSQYKETLHQVTITRGFSIGIYEITQDQYYSVTENNPLYQDDVPLPCINGNCPQAKVSWNDAAAFCNGLSELASLENCYECSGDTKVNCEIRSIYEGSPSACKGYRLPTEAEWEYSYRAGTTTPFYNGQISVCAGRDSNADSMSWYHSNSTWIQKVGTKESNPWGIFDMAGNVFELTSDGWKEDLGSAAVTDPSVSIAESRITVRGGQFSSQPAMLRASQRSYAIKTSGDALPGFRILLTR